MPFRPQFWPTVFTIPMLLGLLALGTWQLQRLDWKRELIAERTERSAAPAVPLPADASPAALADLEFRRSAAAGRFLHEREMYLAARSLRGNPGYHLYTPLRLADGRSIIVNRGWIPQELKDPARRAPGQADGTVAVDGLIRIERAQRWLEPDNEPEENLWFWPDLPAMTAHAGLGPVPPFYLEAGPAENPGGFPIGGQTRISLPNDHLQYAITWYALAVALAVIYVLYHRRNSEPGPP